MATRTRILYLSPSLTQGGAERHVVELVRNLDEATFEPAMCVVRPGIHFRGELPPGEPRYLLGRRLFTPGALRGVVRAIEDFRPDVLHAHLNDGNLLGRLATTFTKVPAVVTSVHLDEMSPPYRMLERLMWRRSDRIVAVSRGVKDFLVGTVGLPDERVQVVVNGVDPTRFVPGDDQRRAAARARFDVAPERLVGLMPARLSRQKNQERVVEALAELKTRGRLPPEFLLLLAGRSSSESLERKVRGLVAQARLDEQVRFLGPVSEMQELYWASDVLLMPSITEGSSLAAFEAMAAGLPVLISRRSNSDGAIIDGEHGWQIADSDTTSIARALTVIIETPGAERLRLGRQGRARVEGRYTVARVARDFESLYGSVLQAAGR
ncbi:MAG TPA: glycosyltransferase family 4 protein [Polyangia bacterium]|jgi:glycosyltransferase involved in cell wall biosynthesis|nr:glycosyltransferase family 4 protein [Polyangia bacterium]